MIFELLGKKTATTAMLSVATETIAVRRATVARAPRLLSACVC